MRTLPTDASEQTKRSIDLLWDEIERLNRQLEEMKTGNTAKSVEEFGGITSLPDIKTTEGIQGNSNGTFDSDLTLRLDINGLTEDTAPVITTDYVATYDASTSLHKKVLPKNFKFSRRLHTNTTPVGNVGAGTDDLITYTLPGATLATDGDILHCIFSGITANNASLKQGTIYFGAANSLVVSTSGASIYWLAEMWVIRTGATTQMVHIRGNSNGEAVYNQWLAGTETLANNITIKATGSSAGAANDDIVQKSLAVMYHPA